MTHNTPTQVYKSYWKKLSDLPDYERFHFLTRLFLVTNDAQAAVALKEWGSSFVQLDDQQLFSKLQEILTNNAPVLQAETRDFYLSKYPGIRLIARDLFAYFFAQRIFQRDLTAQVSYLHDPKYQAMADALSADRESLTEISAYAINFIILLEVFLAGDNSQTSAEQFYQLHASLYTPDSPKNIELSIYYLTHIIIADSVFYTQKLPTAKQKLYIEILQKIDSYLADHFANINLDCKVETIVCGKLIGYHSPWTDKIGEEADNSLSDDGTFILDKHNNHPQTHRTSFVTSEHRNVLYLMAFYQEIKL